MLSLSRTYLAAIAALALVLLMGATGCRPAAPITPSTQLKVVATTSILADVVSVVGGESIDLDVLLPLGGDAHTFQPTPKDATALAQAQVIFINGLGLELFLEPLLENAGGQAAVFSVSVSIPTIALESGEIDPHVWLDPNNLIVWADNIAAALSELDAANASLYRANAAAYQTELRTLDTWITVQIAQIPAGRRAMVSDHAVFGYFAARYGFELIGAIIPGYSTLAEPSARELAALQDAILAAGAPAIFVGEALNANLAQRVAEDTRTQLVFVYTGSLSAADGPAATYLQMMRYNVKAIVAALRKELAQQGRYNECLFAKARNDHSLYSALIMCLLVTMKLLVY